MIYRDLFCDCGYIEKDVVFNSINENINKKCPICHKTLKNLCTCGTFELKYDNKKDICGWSADNYNSSQYYNEIKGK